MVSDFTGKKQFTGYLASDSLKYGEFKLSNFCVPNVII